MPPSGEISNIDGPYFKEFDNEIIGSIRNPSTVLSHYNKYTEFPHSISFSLDLNPEELKNYSIVHACPSK